METEIITKICTRCKKMLSTSSFDTKRNGDLLQRCKECNLHLKALSDKKKCEHGREKRRCRDCGGQGFCKHNTRKSRCRICGGGEFCEHNKIKTRCITCGGSEMCEHKIRRVLCRICDGSGFCEHDKQKHLCLLCDGASICIHKTRRIICRICKGSSICEHDKLKSICSICDFGGYLSGIVRSAVHRGLKENKDERSINYLGCSIDEFKAHIEGQFKDGMTWDNYAIKWQIDHKIPLKFENPTLEEIIERLNYKNTQPMPTLENLSKGNRYIK